MLLLNRRALQRNSEFLLIELGQVSLNNRSVSLPLKCLQQYVQLAIMEGGGAPITCPDMACGRSGVLLDSEVCPL